MSFSISSSLLPYSSTKYSNQGISNSRIRGSPRTFPSKNSVSLPIPSFNNGSLSSSLFWSSSLQQPSKVHGSVNCMLAIFNEIDWCNQTYYQALNHVIIKGYRKESRVYRRQYCCGHWSRERCIFNAAQRKCDHETYEKIREDPSSIVDSRYSNINCDEYEHNAPVCGSIGQYHHQILILVLILISSFMLWFFFY